MLPPASREFAAAQQRITKAARNEVARVWRQGMRQGRRFDESWRLIEPAIVDTIAAAQLALAERSVTYLDALAKAESAVPVAELVPRSLAGVASDGRRLDTLTYRSVVNAGLAVNAGAAEAVGLARGGAFLDLVSSLQIADAARSALSVGIAVRPAWKGYVRAVNPPCCPRCAILAGRWYRWSTGFQRHPHCDCTHLPTSDPRSEYRQDPAELIRQGRVGGLSRADQQAVLDGADPSRIVNARRGLSLPASRRYYQPRPEAIYKTAVDRTDAIRLLKIHGYIT